MAYIDDLKLRMPVDSIGISRGFTSSHRGVDFGWNASAGGENVDIFAPADGIVVAMVEGMGNDFASGVPNWGNFVKIDHGGDVYTLSAHMLRGSINVAGIKLGSRVMRGQRIGKMNNSGYSNGSHNHFEVYNGGAGTGSRVDPLFYIYVYPDQEVRQGSALQEKIMFIEEKKRVGVPVERNMAGNQIQIRTDVNARSNPNLGSTILGLWALGFYDVRETLDMTHEESNGYVWYGLRDGWCAGVSGVDFLGKEENPEPYFNPTEEDWLAVRTLADEIKAIAEKHIKD